MPKKVLLNVEHRFRTFLWSGHASGKYYAKVAWSNTCIPKDAGGLGIKDLHIWNKALMTRYIWNLLMNDKSVWVSWIDHYFLNGRSFWSIVPTNLCSWNWRKLLKLRDSMRLCFHHTIGDGRKTFLWHDNWHPFGLLFLCCNNDSMISSGIGKDALVSSIVVDSHWAFPHLTIWI